MTHAGNVTQRQARPFEVPAAAIITVVLATIILVAAQLTPISVFSPATSAPNNAALEAGREWQVRYEQMSGLSARRERHDEALLQAGRDWEIRYEQMAGG